MKEHEHFKGVVDLDLEAVSDARWPYPGRCKRWALPF